MPKTPFAFIKGIDALIVSSISSCCWYRIIGMSRRSSSSLAPTSARRESACVQHGISIYSGAVIETRFRVFTVARFLSRRIMEGRLKP
jgi:hypothetical protein